jgi:type II secretory pathway component GspD/PulD (secretin)
MPRHCKRPGSDWCSAQAGAAAPAAPGLTLQALASAFLVFLFLSAVARAGEQPPASAPVTPPGPAAPPGGFVGQAVQINNAPAAEIKKVLLSVATPGGAVLDQPGGRSLMIVDTPEKNGRLGAIKDALDVTSFANARFNVYQPRGVSAEELAREINELKRNGILPSAPLSGIYVAALPLGNVLLTIGRNDEAWIAVRQWLEKLDRPGAAQRQVYVYPLESKEAEQAAKAAASALAKPAEKKDSAPPGRRFEIVFDEPTRSLILYATPAEFQEIKSRLNPDTGLAHFKQRLAAIAQEFAAAEPPPSPSPKRPDRSAF